jgi:hypothetical protein
MLNFIGQYPDQSHFVDEDVWQLGYIASGSIGYKYFSLLHQPGRKRTC